VSSGPLVNLLVWANRLQHARWFKLVASFVVIAAAIAVSASYWVRLEAKRQENKLSVIERPGEAPPAGTAPGAQAPDAKAAGDAERMRTAARTAAESTARALNKLRESQTDATVVFVGAAGVAGVLLAVIWLEAGLTALGILFLLGAVAIPLMRFGGPTARDTGRFIAAVGSLSFAFVVLMQMLRVALSGSNAISAIARNVVQEAVRIKVSLVFIVLLLLVLAALPGLSDPETPLRYRVQTFLQYGSGGTFWIIAILVLFLAIASVAFEQRDKVIWQTMTKPVAAWQYVLGKWLGVVGVAAVLLLVSSTGVFLFTEYLRDQKAYGESAPYQNKDTESVLPSEDRMVLETQVLTARTSVGPELPDLDLEAVYKEIDERAAKLKAADLNYEYTDAEKTRLAKEFSDEIRSKFFAIGGGRTQRYIFTGLSPAKDRDSSVTLRYKVDIGANDPKQLHRLTIVTPNAQPEVKEIPLGQTMQMTISPSAIDSKGILIVSIINGDFYRAQSGDPEWAGADTMTFPPDGLDIFYSVGSYHANFLRVMLVLWIKLAFLAMIAILAATFLSFAVASLVAFGTFMIAESAGFLYDALDYYASTGTQGEIILHRVLIRAIAVPISRMFSFYAQLKPTANLVDGLVVPWDKVLLTAGVLGTVTLVLYIAAVLIFRRRELATYSGR